MKVTSGWRATAEDGDVCGIPEPLTPPTEQATLTTAHNGDDDTNTAPDNATRNAETTIYGCSARRGFVVRTYLYTEQWNPMTGDPIGGMHWFTEDEAREAFTKSRPLEVVGVTDAVPAEGPVNPNWVIGFGNGAVSPWVRVQLYSPNRSVVQLNDYQHVADQLFCADTTEYAYPDESRRYGLSESTAMRRLVINQDGSGTIQIEDEEAGVRKRAEVRDIPVAGLWMAFPQFGEWDSLADPHFGFDTERF